MTADLGSDPRTTKSSGAGKELEPFIGLDDWRVREQFLPEGFQFSHNLESRKKFKANCRS